MLTFPPLEPNMITRDIGHFIAVVMGNVIGMYAAAFLAGSFLLAVMILIGFAIRNIEVRS